MPNNGYFDTPFAVGGDLNTIPDAAQPSGTVSYEQGFPVLYSTAVTSGGYNVPRTAFNQVLNDITTAIQFNQQGNAAPFITASMNGGSSYAYEKYALVSYAGVAYLSLVGANTDTPPTPNWMPLNFRIPLITNAAFYVATTGSDSNNGTSGSPWLTVQHAYDTICLNYDLRGFTATINVETGTYAAGLNATNCPVGGAAGSILINGIGTPLVNTASSNAFQATGTGVSYSVQNLAIGGGVAIALFANEGAQIFYGGTTFGTTSAAQVAASNGASVICTGNYLITGNAPFHWDAFNNGVIVCVGKTITLSGTPAFAAEFATAGTNGSVVVEGNTFTGSATGSRYNVNSNGVVYTQGAGASYLPGSSAGTSTTGGQYI